MNNLSFSEALTALRDGAKIARDGWNGKRMFIFLTHPISIEYPGKDGDSSIDFAETMPACITMMTATHELQLGWLASQADMLSDDWCIVPTT